jgi:Concanavalin A-like lectin/glucanases superfamily
MGDKQEIPKPRFAIARFTRAVSLEPSPFGLLQSVRAVILFFARKLPMHRNPALLLVLTVAGSFLLPAGTVLAETKAPRRADSKLEIALHYDFFAVVGPRIGDLAAQKHDGTLQNGEIVFGKRKPAVKFDGKGSISVAGSPDELSPAQKAFSVGALCQPAAPNGVVIAMGNDRDGFSLYLRDGVAHFAVRSNGELSEVAGEDTVVLDQWVHLCGAVGADGQLQLVVNGWPVAKVQGKLIAKTPEKPLCIGADFGGPVGDYKGPLSWRGLLEDVRLYWGVMDRNEHRDELSDWADLPGCGCKK